MARFVGQLNKVDSLVLGATVTGALVLLASIALVGFSSVRTGGALPFALGVATLLVGVPVGAGAVYVAALPLVRKTDGGRPSLAWAVRLVSVVVLGQAIYVWVTMSHRDTVPDATIMGLAIGANSMAIMRISAFTKRRRSG